MNTITQTMRLRQALIQYSLKYGVTKAAIRYKVNRQYVYRWQKRYDGTLQSLADKSHRPHHYPNQHTEAELKLISNMRKRNPIKTCQAIRKTIFITSQSATGNLYLCQNREKMRCWTLLPREQ